MIRLKYVGDGGWIQHPEPGRKPPPAADFVVCTPAEVEKIPTGVLARIVPDPEAYVRPLLEKRAVSGEGADETSLPPLYERVGSRKKEE